MKPAPDSATEPRPEPGRAGYRWVWFVGLWAAGVLTVSGVAMVIRAMVLPASG